MNVVQYSLIWIISIFILLLSYNLYDHVIGNDLNTGIYEYFLSSTVSINNKPLEYHINIKRKEIDIKDIKTVNDNNPLNNSIMILPLPKIVSTSTDKRIITLDLKVNVNISIIGNDIGNDIDTVKDTIDRFICQSVSKYYNSSSEPRIEILRIPIIEVIIGYSLSNEFDDSHHDEHYIHFSDKITITAKNMNGKYIHLKIFL